MAGEAMSTPAPAPEQVPTPRTRWGRRLLIGLGGLLALLALLLIAGSIWLGTDSGRRFVARQIEALSFENGLQIGLGRIEGSLFNRMRLRDVTLRDPQGVFLSAPTVELDYRPLAYLRSHIDVRALTIPNARFHRLPRFNPTAPSEGPLLPDLDIDVSRLEIGRLRIDPPVTGQAHLVRFSGTVHIADRRAQIRADGRAIAAPGVAGGDRLALRLDAVPDDNRLDIDLKLDAPAQGLVAGLSGIGQRLALSLAGKGDWRAWNGTLSGNLGAERLADVALTARDGTFTVRGPVRPGLFLTGPGRNMLEPVTQLDLVATADQRRITLKGGAASDNFTFSAEGLVDLGESRMEDLALSFRLLKPSVIAQNLRGADITANAMLNGRFVAPEITYGLTARQIGFGATLVEGLDVAGSAALDKDQWRIPVHGRAARITGINASVAPLLTNVRLDGTLAYANARLLSDDLRLHSDRIDAKAVIVADLDKALYTGALDGRVNGYRVESIGIFNVSTDMDLKSGANGYFKLGGRVTARSTRLLNDGLRSVLGGNALIVADVGYDSNGVASLDSLRVAAPDFRVTQARGRYGADGRIALAARGESRQYGPFTLEASGTAARPVAHVTAPRPGLGVGLADVSATVRGAGDAYLVTADAGTDYGPLALDAAVTMGPLAVELRQDTSFSGVRLTGRLAQTAAGPFAGTLRTFGSGLDGSVVLSAASGNQRAVVDMAGQDVNLSGKVGLAARRLLLKADIVLEEQPRIVADGQIAGMRLGELYIAAARANADYRGGTGNAKMLVEGRTRYPFRLAANARLDPRLWRVALNGRINGIDVATQEALRIVPSDAGYALQPATIMVDKGRLHLAGRYGPGVALQARFDGVDLSIADPFTAGLGLGGMASGSLDFSQPSDSAFPSADLRVKIDDFTRTSLAAVSEPVDLALTGRLVPTGGNASAIIRRRGAAIGRMQLALEPLPPESGGWMTRLMAAPLSGGVRYNGPADVLFSLAALPDQSLKGPIGVAADFSGRLDAPQLTGVVRAKALVYENAQYGTRLTDMALSGRFTNDRLQVDSLTARAGSGTVSASGFVSLSSAQGFPVQLGIEMNDAQLARGQDLEARATGSLQIVNGPNRAPAITGSIALPETHYRIVRQGAAQVATLTGVRRKPALGRERISGSPEPMQSLPSTWALDVAVRADNRIYVTGMGLESEWAADIKVGGTSGAPRITGGVQLVRGTLGFAGHSFELQEGRITFNGGDMTNPELRIVASGDVEDVTIVITITGTGSNPQIVFSSTPALPQDELMARILFGNSVGELSTLQAVQLAASLNGLRGGKGGLNPLGVLQSSSGIDRLRILGADKETGRGTSLAVGQYISNDVYIEIVTDTRGYTATQLEVSLSKALSVLSQMGSFGGSSVNLRYRKDY